VSKRNGPSQRTLGIITDLENTQTSVAEIAEKFCVSVTRVYRIISQERKRGRRFPMRQRTVQPSKTPAIIADLENTRTSVAEIAEKFGVSTARIYQIINDERKRGRCFRKRQRKVNPSKTPAIIAAIEAGERPVDIMRRFQVTKQHVYFLRKRRNDEAGL
jgi:transposase